MPVVPPEPTIPIPKYAAPIEAAGTAELADFDIKGKEEFLKLPPERQGEIWKDLNPAAQDAISSEMTTAQRTEFGRRAGEQPVQFGPKSVDPKQVDFNTRLPNQSVTQEHVHKLPADHNTMMVDIDHFRAINNTFGHQKGDEILRQTGDLLNKHFPDYFRGRYGGEEAMVDFGPGELNQQLVDRIKAFHDDFTRSININGEPVTISIGVGKGKAEAKLVSDVHLFKAKEAGRNQIVVEKDGDISYIKGEEIGEKPYLKAEDRRVLDGILQRRVQNGEIDEGAADRIRKEVFRIPPEQGRGEPPVPARTPAELTAPAKPAAAGPGPAVPERGAGISGPPERPAPVEKAPATRVIHPRPYKRVDVDWSKYPDLLKHTDFKMAVKGYSLLRDLCDELNLTPLSDQFAILTGKKSGILDDKIRKYLADYTELLNRSGHNNKEAWDRLTKLGLGNHNGNFSEDNPVHFDDVRGWIANGASSMAEIRDIAKKYRHEIAVAEEKAIQDAIDEEKYYYEQQAIARGEKVPEQPPVPKEAPVPKEPPVPAEPYAKGLPAEVAPEHKQYAENLFKEGFVNMVPTVVQGAKKYVKLTDNVGNERLIPKDHPVAKYIIQHAPANKVRINPEALSPGRRFDDVPAEQILKNQDDDLVNAGYVYLKKVTKEINGENKIVWKLFNKEGKARYYPEDSKEIEYIQKKIAERKGGAPVPETPAPAKLPAISAPGQPATETELHPSEAQKEAGNYKKEHIRRDGMEISIENPAGSVRSGTDKQGKAWSQQLHDDYGYIRGTKGKDKDHIDVFIRPGSGEGGPVFVIDQVNPKTGAFDEHKVMMGFNSPAAAREGYLSNYEPGWQGIGAITELPIDKFKEWVYSDNTQKPLGKIETKPLLSPVEQGIIKGKKEVITTTKEAPHGTATAPAAGRPEAPEIPTRAGRPGAVERGAAEPGGGPAEGGNAVPTDLGGGGPRNRPGGAAVEIRKPAAGRGPGDGVSGPVAGTGSTGSGNPRGDEPAVIERDSTVASKQQRLINYLISEADNIGRGGPVQKFSNNISAITILKKIETENRYATPDEQEALVKYVGWGGLSNSFKKGTANDDLLRSMLTPEEYEAARRSTINAHYTSPPVIQAVWNAVTRMGFTGGATLEPAMGIGHFYGLRPTDLNMSMEGIELDSLSGRIARQLYQNAEIRIQGYETIRMPKDYYNLILSNVPFWEGAPVEPRDVRTPGLTGKESLHNFYFLKSLYGTKPGGLVAFITSHYTMDAKTSRDVREAIAGQADFLGAIRLPETAFKQNAGTEVVTDIIFLQKRAPGQAPSDLNKIFIEAEPVSMFAPKAGNQKEVHVAKYFINKPEMIIGKPSLEGQMRAPDQYTVRLDDEITPDGFNDMLGAAVETLPADIMAPYVEQTTLNLTAEKLELPEEVKRLPDGSYFIDKGVLYQKDPLSGHPYKVPEGKDKNKIERLTTIKDIMQKMFTAERTEAGAGTKKYLTALNNAYDSFVKQHGPISNRANLRAIEDDPAQFQLAALEDYDQKSNTAKKAAIFSGFSFAREKTIEKTGSPQEALLVTLNKYGSVNIHHIARMMDMDGPAAVDRLLAERLIFRSHDDFLNGKREAYQTREEYLSGNVRQKLERARLAAKKDRAFELNVRELEVVIPPDKPAERISIKMNSPVLETKDVEEFLKELFSAHTVRVTHNDFNGQFDVDVRAYGYRAINETYGVPEMNGVDIVKEVLAGRRPQIYDTVSAPTPENPRATREEFNELKTAAAQAKADEIKKKFAEWVWSDNDRKTRLVRAFNDRFNAFVNREYIHPQRVKDPTTSVFFPGSVFPWPARTHQADSVWRIAQTQHVMLAHGVGSGKTLEMIWGGMEAKRLGLIKKPMYVFPNNLLRQWTSDFYSAYPHAKVLVANEGDLSPERRRVFINKIATGDWDAVLVKREDHIKISLSPREEAEQIRYLIAQFQKYVDSYNETGGGERQKPRSVKNVEKMLESYKGRVQVLMNRARKERGMLYFEDLGVDALFIDEADEYKNLQYYTTLESVKGMGQQAGSGRAMDMLMKSRYLARKGAKIVYATGTAISNSLVEAYSMMRYLQEDWLHENGIENFDDWSRMFADTVTEMELDNTGSSYKPVTRFSRLTNVPEFMKALREVWDIKTNDYLKENNILVPGKNLPHEKVINISAPATDLMKSFKRYLVKREKELSHKKPEKGNDNVLVIIDDGRKAALDLRLFSPLLPDLPESKLNLAVNKILELHKRYEKQRYTQLVFIERPRSYGYNREGNKIVIFDATADMIKKFVTGGVKRDEIVDITEDKYSKASTKFQLFSDMRAGKVRILIGSVGKMGVGANVQDRVKAVHQLDAKWRPRDYEQSNGRGVRQGNKVVDFDDAGKQITPEGQLGHVEIYNYVTKGSLDTGIWNMLEVKAKAIKTIMNTKPEDLDDEIEEDYFGSVKELSIEDPVMKEAVTVRQRVKELTTMERVHINDISHKRAEIRAIPERIDRLGKNIKAYETDITQRAAEPKGDEFSMEVGGKKYDKRTEAGAALIREITENEKRVHDKLGLTLSFVQTKKNIGTYAGFPLSLRTEKISLNVFNDKTKLYETKMGYRNDVIAEGKYNYIGSLDPETRNPLGLIASLHNALYKRMDQNLQQEKDARTDQEKALAEHKATVDMPFAQTDELAQKKQRQGELDKILAEHKEEEVKPEDEPFNWAKQRQYIPTTKATEEGKIEETPEGKVEETSAPYGEPEPPATMMSGYPPKEFKFTGEWESVLSGGAHAARRNRVDLWHPIYKAADGEQFIHKLITRKENPNIVSETPAEYGKSPIHKGKLTPAVLVADKIFTGLNHGDALNKAMRAGLVTKKDLDQFWGTPNLDLFVLDDGRVITRLKAGKDFDIWSSETADVLGRLSTGNRPSGFEWGNPLAEKRPPLKVEEEITDYDLKNISALAPDFLEARARLEDMRLSKTPADLGLTDEDVRLTFGSMEKVNETDKEVQATLRKTRIRSASASVRGRQPAAGRPYSRTPGTIRGVGPAGKSIIHASWNKSKRIDLTGKPVTSAQEVAELFSVYRHPNLEQMHLIYLDENNNILAHNMMSVGLANEAPGVEYTEDFARSMHRIQDRMERLGASSLYLLHNHPGGNPKPSRADRTLSDKYYRYLGKKIKGHIVIDDTRYSFINGAGDIEELPYTPKVTYDLPVKKVANHNDVVDLVKGVIAKGAAAVQVVLDNQNKVTAWFPLNVYGSDIKKTIYQNQANAGGTFSIVASQSSKKVAGFNNKLRAMYGSQKGAMDDVLLDFVFEREGEPDVYESARDYYPMAPTRNPQTYAPGFVWEDAPAYESLPPEKIREYLGAWGLSEKDWDVIRGKTPLNPPRPTEKPPAPPGSEIVSPIDRNETPEQKLMQLAKLSRENMVLVHPVLREIDKALGTRSKWSFKGDEKILAKAQRPEILVTKPWYDIEHVRDAFRFKTVVNNFDDMRKHCRSSLIGSRAPKS